VGRGSIGWAGQGWHDNKSQPIKAGFFGQLLSAFFKEILKKAGFFRRNFLKNFFFIFINHKSLQKLCSTNFGKNQ